MHKSDQEAIEQWKLDFHEYFRQRNDCKEKPDDSYDRVYQALSEYCRVRFIRIDSLFKKFCLAHEAHSQIYGGCAKAGN